MQTYDIKVIPLKSNTFPLLNETRASYINAFQTRVKQEIIIAQVRPILKLVPSYNELDS